MNRTKIFPLAAASALVLSACVARLGEVSEKSSREIASVEASPFSVTSRVSHKVQVVDSGIAALELRLQMIERARTRIDVEYFIYNKDRAGRIFTRALLEKKRKDPSIEIRVLIDTSPAIFEFTGPVINLLAEHKIPVKYYNQHGMNNRNHRKLLTIDGPGGPEAITGGRNIADEYFDMSEKFNFIDRDMHVQGPIAEDMHKTFDQFWHSDFVTDAKLADLSMPVDSDSSERSGPGNVFEQELKKYRAESVWTMSLDPTSKIYGDQSDADLDAARQLQTEDRALTEQIHKIGSARLADAETMGNCDDLSLATDEPGFDRDGYKQKRYVFNSIFARLSALRNQKIVIESPYFIVTDKRVEAAMESFGANGVKATLLTNSLASTDAFYVAANFGPRRGHYASLGNIYAYSGDRPDGYSGLKVNGRALVENATWGIHAKTYVFGDKEFAIGTFNSDPRSANINTEMMLFCRGNEKLTRHVVEEIQRTANQSDEYMKDGVKAKGTSQASLLKDIEFILSIVPATLLESYM